MALSKNDLAFIHRLGESSFANAEMLHMAGVKAVSKAYGGDKGEFGQRCCDVLRVTERIELAKFLKKHGLNVSIDKTHVIVQGPLNSKRADRDIREAKADIAFFRLVDAHIQQRKQKEQKPKKEDNRTATEKAKDAVEKFIRRIEDETVRSIVYRMIQKPQWYLELSQIFPSEEEARIATKAILAYRKKKREKADARPDYVEQQLQKIAKIQAEKKEEFQYEWQDE